MADAVALGDWNGFWPDMVGTLVSRANKAGICARSVNLFDAAFVFENWCFENCVPVVVVLSVAKALKCLHATVGCCVPFVQILFCADVSSRV